MNFANSMKIPILVLYFLFWSSMAAKGLPAPTGERDFTGENHALIIGIGNYDHWPKLKSPTKDAEELSRILLEKYNFKKSNVSLLTDKTIEKPTLVNILTYLDRYLKNLTEKDNLLVFFSGHSLEDEDGETYWIPKDGQKKSKMTWLGHTALCNDVFASPHFKVKSLCIMTDSPFSNKLIRPKPISLTPFDLRYTEKIKEKAENKSREVLSFGDQHWPGTKNTEGLGLFTYYIRKALTENELEVIDLENLIFDENIIFPITKIAGTKLVHGRIRTPMDRGGQFVITIVIPSHIVNIISASVNPEKAYPGDNFTVTAKTNEPAYEVYIKIENRRYPMEGKDTEWEYTKKIEKLGKMQFYVTAINEKGVEGKGQGGRIITIKPQVKPTNVQEVRVEPKTGLGGDFFRFTATTDTPAREVHVRMNGKIFKMNGSDTQWSIKKRIDDIGTIDFSVVATNNDGVKGSPKTGNIEVEAGVANVVELRATPQTGYAGEEFTITVKTDRPAEAVNIQMDGKIFPMDGSGRAWTLKKNIPEIGKKEFIAIAINSKGTEGASKREELLTQKSPSPISNVALVDVKVVSPGKGYAGDTYEINVKTTTPADAVYLDIEGKQYDMKGSGSVWNYLSKIDKVGSNKYRVSAKNKDGVLGKTKEGEIKTIRKPALPVNVLTVSVSPKKGPTDKNFTFKAKTDRIARSVTLILGKKPYDMTGSGTDWSLSKKIDDTGTIDFSVVAKNKNGNKGSNRTSTVTVLRDRFKKNADGTVTDLITGKVKNRFADNGDGTITDLVTNLMWLKSPKQIALSWGNAVEYCRKLDYKSLSGWRLPTIGEWRKMTDPEQKNPSLPPENPFTNVVTHVGYWSKTKHKFGPKYVYQMSMWTGKATHLNKQENAIVWPVRYAETPE